ncbi:uncharacterized protein LOC132543890 [Ylistrum balloti]|uniref:uncharacterized protein LOC132543890 n=1 Tax=Ylistrum balloti TaxID=509963 RepID=UPI002905D6C6|nr:uncharacterized protein LOC132543890 [Ylistrum balloti]
MALEFTIKPVSLSLVLFIALICLCKQMAWAGWTADGGYEGAYPGGCTKLTGECPEFEHCIYDEEECRPGSNLCRCMYGCVMDGHYLRYEQWRRLPGRGICMCENPTKNKTKCVEHLDEF